MAKKKDHIVLQDKNKLDEGIFLFTGDYLKHKKQEYNRSLNKSKDIPIITDFDALTDEEKLHYNILVNHHGPRECYTSDKAPRFSSSKFIEANPNLDYDKGPRALSDLNKYYNCLRAYYYFSDPSNIDTFIQNKRKGGSIVPDKWLENDFYKACKQYAKKIKEYDLQDINDKEKYLNDIDLIAPGYIHCCSCLIDNRYRSYITCKNDLGLLLDFSYNSGFNSPIAFFTFTISDEYLTKYGPDEYIRWFQIFANKYLGIGVFNVDYGKDDRFTHRIHIHGLACALPSSLLTPNRKKNSIYKYRVNFKRFHELYNNFFNGSYIVNIELLEASYSDKDQLANYITKLGLHGSKYSTGLKGFIYTDAFKEYKKQVNKIAKRDKDVTRSVSEYFYILKDLINLIGDTCLN